MKTPEVQKEMVRGEKKADETVWDPTDRDVDDARAIGATKEELDSAVSNLKNLIKQIISTNNNPSEESNNQ